MTKRKQILSFGILLLFTCLSTSTGCTPKIHTIVPDFEQNKPRSIAVMPLLNETNDLDAPKVMTPMVYNCMQTKGYEIRSPQEIKSLLAKKNIHEAGQVFSLTYPELGKLLGVDALLFCTVTDWSSVYLLVYSSVTVEAKFELIKADNGARLWEVKDKSSKIKIALDQKSFEETLTNAMFSPYEPRARIAIQKCLSTLPNGPYYVILRRTKKGCLAP